MSNSIFTQQLASNEAGRRLRDQDMATLCTSNDKRIRQCCIEIEPLSDVMPLNSAAHDISQMSGRDTQ
ncbi:hypothetical protein [Rhizobium tubonense]|uniref:hypothetical protein n=1 Tax=Rhizobium tubonense TaxID=484088 RepID=UPI0018A82EB9|nr:hypothetical protein [Rhizobium tubonense]